MSIKLEIETDFYGKHVTYVHFYHADGRVTGLRPTRRQPLEEVLQQFGV